MAAQKQIVPSMKPGQVTFPEQELLRARARGEVSCDESFDQFYAVYAPIVRAWTVFCTREADREDLFQDIWTIFYHRWQGWRFLPEMDVPDARPVISFLYRTFRFTLEGHQRKAFRFPKSLDELETDLETAKGNDLLDHIELGRCLGLAQKICSSGEMDVLLCKLSGIPAREIAQSLSITESVVDHRFRGAIARIQKRLKIKRTGERKKK